MRRDGANFWKHNVYDRQTADVSFIIGIINGNDLLCEEFKDTKMGRFLVYPLFTILIISLHSLFLFVLFHIEKYKIQHFFLLKEHQKSKLGEVELEIYLKMHKINITRKDIVKILVQLYQLQWKIIHLLYYIIYNFQLIQLCKKR